MTIPMTFKPIEVTLAGSNWPPTKPFEEHPFWPFNLHILWQNSLIGGFWAPSRRRWKWRHYFWCSPVRLSFLSLVSKIPAEALVDLLLWRRKTSTGFDSPFYRGLIKEIKNVTKLTFIPLRNIRTSPWGFLALPLFPSFFKSITLLNNFQSSLGCFLSSPLVLKSSVTLNNSGCIIAMKYGFSQGKASYPWGEKWFDRATPHVDVQSNTLHIFPFLSQHELWKASKNILQLSFKWPSTLPVMSSRTDFWIAWCFGPLVDTHFRHSSHTCWTRCRKRLLLLARVSTSSLTALWGIHRFFPDPL